MLWLGHYFYLLASSTFSSPRATITMLNSNKITKLPKFFQGQKQKLVYLPTIIDSLIDPCIFFTISFLAHHKFPCPCGTVFSLIFFKPCRVIFSCIIGTSILSTSMSKICVYLNSKFRILLLLLLLLRSKLEILIV